MAFDTTRRQVLIGTAATLALPAYLRRAHAMSAPRVAGVHASPVENAWNSRIHLAMQEAAEAGKIVYAFLMGSSGGPEGDTFGVFGTRNHEAAYLAGMLAGKMSASNVFGSVGGYPIPEVNLLINAFRMGVMEVNSDATFLNGFIGAWFDPARAKEAAIAQIDAGADILFGERIGTADAAQERGVKAIGSLIDYTPRYPETVFANAIWNYGPTIEAIVADIADGNPVGRDYTEYSFMKHGGNALIYVEDMVPADAVPAMEDRRAAIEAGEFDVPIDAEEPA